MLMFRQFDWDCIDCSAKLTSTVDVPHGEEVPDNVLWPDLELPRCAYCGGVDGARRCRADGERRAV